MFSYYSKLSSEVYNIDNYIGLSFGDVEFYIDRLAACHGKILEPCVGTGRILIPLLEQGLHVEGFDASEEMLQICRQHCDHKGLFPRLFIDQMQSFSLDTRYEAIIIPTGSFLLLQKREDSIQALKNFYHHLHEGGKILIDLFLQTDFTIGSASTRTWEVDKDHMITLESKMVEVNHIDQYTITHNRYEKWKNGELIQTELERFPLRWYGVEEFRTLLEQIGFKNIVISANYRYGEYPKKSGDVITFEANR